MQITQAIPLILEGELNGGYAWNPVFHHFVLPRIKYKSRKQPYLYLEENSTVDMHGIPYSTLGKITQITHATPSLQGGN